MVTPKPRMPSGLAAGGRKLWRSVLAEFELDAAEIAALEQAARVLDQITRLEAELDGRPLIVTGSTGQDRPHPLLAEVRGQRAVLCSLLGRVSLPAELDQAAVRQSPQARIVSAKARKAATARWNQQRARDGA